MDPIESYEASVHDERRRSIRATVVGVAAMAGVGGAIALAPVVAPDAVGALLARVNGTIPPATAREARALIAPTLRPTPTTPRAARPSRPS